MTGIETLQCWQGRTKFERGVVDRHAVSQMAGTLGLEQAPVEGDELPAPWHWLLFTPVPNALETGEDGHPAKGGFLPPVQLPRRMWAGSRVTCHRPLRLGQAVDRTSSISKVASKTGRSGKLVFVTLDHQICNGTGELLLSEVQDLVYRQAAATTNAGDREQPHQPPDGVQFSETIMPDPVLLFRYSALTFNSHRIHYDREYAVNGEGYPGLVVQAPLTASLLLDLMYRRLGTVCVKRFSFRGVRPLFDTAPFAIAGRVDREIVSLWALTPQRTLAMSLDVELEAGEKGRAD